MDAGESASKPRGGGCAHGREAGCGASWVPGRLLGADSVHAGRGSGAGEWLFVRRELSAGWGVETVSPARVAGADAVES